MNRKSTPIPEPIAQLQRQLEQFRGTQSRRTKLPEHARELTANPAEWMPWNYRQTLERPKV